jgi:hypothetical protein
VTVLPAARKPSAQPAAKKKPTKPKTEASGSPPADPAADPDATDSDPAPTTAAPKKPKAPKDESLVNYIKEIVQTSHISTLSIYLLTGCDAIRRAWAAHTRLSPKTKIGKSAELWLAFDTADQEFGYEDRAGLASEPQIRYPGTAEVTLTGVSQVHHGAAAQGRDPSHASLRAVHLRGRARGLQTRRSHDLVGTSPARLSGRLRDETHRPQPPARHRDPALLHCHH